MANKTYPIQIQSKNGLDMDTDASQVAKGDWTYALNARTHSSNKTNLNNANLNLTTGDKRSVKPYLGEENVPTVWRNWAGGTVSAPSAGAVVCGKIEGNGIYNKGYFVFRKFTPTSEYACRISFWSEGVDYLIVTLGNLNQSNSVWLNFDFTAVAQIDDYLYFIGPDNIQYKYPIKGLPSTVTNTTTNPYRLIKVKPLGAPELINEGVYFLQGNQINRVEGNTPDGVQFAYTYKYYDNTETPLSFFTEIYPVIIRNDSPFDVYRVKHSPLDDSNQFANNLRALGVKSLIFYYRQSDTGLWKTIDEFVLDGVNFVQVFFYPTNDGGIALPNNKQNKYFEAIPITSKALETVNGRIFLGNNRLSYTSPVVPNPSSYSIAIGGGNNTLTDAQIFTQDKLKSIKAGGRYNVGVYGLDAFGRVTGITKLSSITIPRKNSILDQAGAVQIELTKNFQNVLTAGISNAVTFPAGTTRYGFAVTKCLNISLFLTGIAKWQYYYIPTNTTGATNPYNGYVLSEAWAPFYGGRAAPTGIAVILNAGEAYQWQLGDRLYVNIGYYCSAQFPAGTVQVANPIRYDFEIIEVFGNVLILDQASAQDWYVRMADATTINPFAYDIQHVAYEIYRPTQDNVTSNLYYAANAPAPISELTSDPATNVKLLEGDVMLVPYGYSAVVPNRIIYNQGFKYVKAVDVNTAINNNFRLEEAETKRLPVLLFKECTTWSVNFPYDQTWNNRTLGWINQPLTISSQIPLDSQTHICFSDPKIAATEVDGTGNFDALNYAIYPQEYGPISKLIRVSDNQLESVGALLMSLFQRETVSIYISRVTLQEITNVAQVLLSDKILGSFNAQLGSFGCINPESVIRQDNRIYYWDATKNKVVRYSRDGLTAISDFGMKSQFALFRDKPTKVYAGYDYPNEELYLTFKTNPALSAPTYVWNEIENRWVTLHTVNPQFYGPSGEYSVFTYFIGGLPKGFTDVNNPSRFNINQVVTPIIDFAVNPDLLIRKNAMAVWLYKNFTPKQGDVGLLVSMNKGWDYFSNETQLTLAGEQPQDNFDGQELLKYTFDKIPYDQLITEANEASFVQGEDWFTFFYATLRIRLGQNKRGIYLINLQYQYEDNEATEGLS
jgi:hypothetical protein